MELGMEASDQPAPEFADKKDRIGIYGWYVVVVLMLCEAVSSLGAKLPFILVEALKADLKFTDTQIGLITGPAYSLTFAIAAIPLAMIADRYMRTRLIVVCILVWSALIALGGLAQSLATFGLSRIGGAIGDAGLSPATHSIIAGYTTPASRPKAMAVYALGTAIGGIAALVAGGFIVDTYGWRTTLFVAGASGVVVALVIALTVKEPERKADAGAKKDLPKGNFRSILGSPAIRNIIIGGTFMGLSSGAFDRWAPAYIMRTFDLSATETGASFGGLAGLTGISGLLLGGFVGSWLAKRRQGNIFRMLAVTFLIATVIQFASLMVVDNYPVFLGLTAASILFVAFYFAPTYAGVQSLSDPSGRSFAAAVTLFSVNGVGIASGAFIVGLLSDQFRSAAGEDSLRWALLTMTLFKFGAAWHYYLAARAIDKMETDASVAEA
jgi:predicted MFS family arabinose efflux permease